MRVATADPAVWPASLGQAATLGFDTLLLPGMVVTDALLGAARGMGVAIMCDLQVGETAAVENLSRPFVRLTEPSLDPRAQPMPANTAEALLAEPADADALAAWWAAPLNKLASRGVAGVRLLGLSTLPGWAVSPFLVALRAACPCLTLFGWTPGLPWPTLEGLPRGTLDLVACSLAWWDGHGDWFWREIDLLRCISPVVAEAGNHPNGPGAAFAATVTEGWMATAETPDAEHLNTARAAIAALPWSRLLSPAGHPVVAVLRTDVPDPRRAAHAALVFTATGRGTPLPIDLVLAACGGVFTPFTPARGTLGQPLHPGMNVEPCPGTVDVYLAQVRPMPVVTSLGRRRAEAAAAVPRVAIEAPSPVVDGGRFPARQVVGTEVMVEADVIADGHDHMAAVLRWCAPGAEEWTEVPMAHLVNDRWAGRFPLERLGVHRYVIEAWRDAYGTFVDELDKKYEAGVPIALELQEGTLLVKAAAERSKKNVRATLNEIMHTLQTGDAATRRRTLMAPATLAIMRRADDRPHAATTGAYPVQAERSGACFASWYEVFPRSMSDDPNRHGTFRDVVKHLPRIEAMGFDVLYFPPVHPIGRKNRKGRNNTLAPAPDDPGSPYAIGSEDGGHDALHPELGSLEDFQHLRAEAALHGIELAIDFAIQCSPDHPWLKQHPDWFTWRPDGTIRYAENPPKKYEDIVNVDFYAHGSVPELWLALANAVMFWASHGIRLFRVDNPHTKPLPFWEWMIAEVQARYPDAVFLAEAFTRPKVMYRLAKVGFSQSYTYFTWRNTKWEFQSYLTELADGPPADFFRPHLFVNTPDINPVPLQTAPRSGFLTRAALAATMSGLWGVYNGFELCEATPVPGREEYLDSEKYQVRAWDWDRPGNITREIAQLNVIRRHNPALQTHLGIHFLAADNEQVILFEKATPGRTNVILVAINLDLRQPQSSRIDIPFWRWTPEPAALQAIDLLNDRIERWTDRHRTVSLRSDQPYAIWRLTPEYPV